MRDLYRLIGWMVVDLIRSRVMLEAEIWTLRQQINVLRRTETAFAQEADVQRNGPLDLCRAVSIGAHSPKRSGGFEARYRYKVAPRPVPIVLALEVTTLWWPTNLADRDTQAYPRDEHRQSAVGSAADPRRVA